MLWCQPHHDGSPLYVAYATPELGETVSVYLRAPHEAGLTQAHVRVVTDGEPNWFRGEVDRADDADTWFRADIVVANPVASYRWLVDGGPLDYRWVNGHGVVEHDVTDAADFKLTTFTPAPDWADDLIVYHVFPDRFARAADRPASGLGHPSAVGRPGGGQRARDAVPVAYGGDLDGIREHLDHIQSLGVNTVYLTPIFPAHSNHRYDAASFDEVDPALGGDAGVGPAVRCVAWTRHAAAR